ncbi:helix-turn-helix domain-containing protein [Flavonifractor sp. An9]|uniref:helix-turn-helix domain-containing protein n=1 Tax=Flavonifractor sp. An9 TaxID=1965664 RepID=UPI000B39B4AE|nr:helix-turn-helix transcriptional regulator [Flavonifractor sp. An9]OUN10825.1 hypothetical protein B5G40_08925 [Flavonifractor sp. An9]
MGNLHETISNLCDKKNVSAYRMCKDIGIRPSIITDLKMGRKKGLSAEVANKIAEYFGVTVGYLLGTEGTKKAPAPEGERSVSDDDIKFALFGGDGDITDEMYDEVKRFAKLVKLREETEKKGEL